MTKRSAVGLCISGMAFSMLGGIAACESDGASGRGPDLQLPDSSFSPLDGAWSGFDATTTDAADADASDAGASDAADAADASDASDGGDQVSYSGLLGQPGGTLYEDRCPAGQLVIGVEGGTIDNGFYAGVLSKLRTLCGTPKLPTDASTVITVEQGTAVPASQVEARGTVAASAVTQATCPANQVVVGITGYTLATDFPPPRDLAAYLQLDCAPLSYTNGAVTIGAAALAGGVGTASGTVAGPFECGANKVAAGMRVHAGDVVDAVRARCEPAVVLP